MRIAMISARFPPTLGGAEIQCYRLSNWLASRGHQVVVLTERTTPDQPFKELLNGFEVIRFQAWSRPPWSSVLYGLQSFFYLLAHPGFDVLHAHMIATPAMVASLARFFLRTPVLIKVAGGRRTGDFNTSRSYRRGRFKLWLFKRGNPFVVCPSLETFEEAITFGITKNKLSYIPNGVDTAYFQPAPVLKTALRRKHGWPEDPPIAIYVGRWAKGKGVEALLDVWEAGASRGDFPWHLAMILSERAPPAIADRIERLKDRIHTAFGVTETESYYQAADLAILLSEGEGLSNFLLEAMACGLPTLTTAAAALPDANGDSSGTRTLTPGGQAVPESLAYLVESAGRPEAFKALGSNARRHIEKNYSLDNIGASYLTLYRKMSRTC